MTTKVPQETLAVTLVGIRCLLCFFPLVSRLCVAAQLLVLRTTFSAPLGSPLVSVVPQKMRVLDVGRTDAINQERSNQGVKRKRRKTFQTKHGDR